MTRIRLEYVPHGTPISDDDRVIEIGHHGRYAVLVERKSVAKRAKKKDNLPDRPANRSGRVAYGD